MNNNNNNHKYDPNVVIAAANAAPDLDSGRFIFQSALLEWVDDAREGGDQLLLADREQIREAVATLWLALAQYLIQAKQFKSATETLDEAVTCPVASSVGRVHAEAARFAVERGKRKTAQTIYVHALHRGVVTDEQDRELLWHDFLELMRETNPQLTLTALQEAVEQEAKNNMRRLWGEDTTAPSLDPLPPLPPEIMAAWMSRDGNSPPQPPTALFAPSPPKLSDPVRAAILVKVSQL